MDRTTENLVRLAQMYAAARGREVTTVSRFATGSGDTIGRLRRGRRITTERAARAIQWFSDHWPDDLDWPHGIPRPAPAASAPEPDGPQRREHVG